MSTTFTVSGLLFQPKAIYLFWSGNTSVTAAEADMKRGQGIVASTSSRRAYTAQSDHAAATSATDSGRYNDSCVVTLTIAGAVDGKADINTITSDGFTLIVDDQFAAAIVVGWIAFGGSDITDVQIVDITEPATATTQDVATTFALDTGVDDKAVIFTGGAYTAMNSANVWGYFMLGFAAGDTPVNTVCSANSEDAAANMITYSYCRTGESIANLDATDAPTNRASVTTWLSTGFRLSWAEVDGTATWGLSALVIKGGRWQVGDALTSTGTSNQVESTTYVPKGIIVASHAKAASTVNVGQAEAELSVGVATSPGAVPSRRTATALDDDAPTTSDIGVGFREDCIYINYDEANALKTTVSGLMDLVSFDATPSFTYVMDDADPSAAYFMYLIAADTPGAPPAGCTSFLTLMGVGCK